MVQRSTINSVTSAESHGTPPSDVWEPCQLFVARWCRVVPLRVPTHEHPLVRPPGANPKPTASATGLTIPHHLLVLQSCLPNPTTTHPPNRYQRSHPGRGGRIFLTRLTRFGPNWTRSVSCVVDKVVRAQAEGNDAAKDNKNAHIG